MNWKLAIILTLLLQKAWGQFDTYLFLNPTDCATCIPQINLASKQLHEYNTVVLTRKISSKDLRLTKEKFSSLDGLVYKEFEDVALQGLNSEDLVYSSLIMAYQDKVFLVKPFRTIHNIHQFFQQAPSLIPEYREEVWHGSEALSSTLQLHYIANGLFFVKDHLTDKEYELQLSSGRLKEYEYSVKTLYHKIGKREQYTNLQKYYKRIQKMGLDTLEVNISQVIGEYQYTFLTIPDVRVVQKQIVVAWYFILAKRHLEETKEKYLLITDKGMKGGYLADLPLLHADEKNYILPLEKDQNYKASDKYLGRFKEKSGTLRYQSYYKAKFPEDFESEHHQYNYLGIKQASGFYAFEYYPAIFSISDGLVFKLPLRPNIFKNGQLVASQFRIYALYHDAGSTYVFYKVDKRYYLLSVNQEKQNTTVEINEGQIISACFGHGFLYLLNQKGTLIKRTFLKL